MKTAWRSYRKHIRWIVLFSLALAVAMGVYTFQYEENVYMSSVQLYVLPTGTDGNAQYDAAASAMLARDSRQLLKNPTLVYEAEEKLNPDTLDGMRVTLDGVAGTHLLELRAYGTRPELCQTAVTAVSVVFMQQLQDTASLETVSVAKRAELPDAPVGPRRVLKTGATFLGAFAAMTLLHFLFGKKRPMLWASEVRDDQFGAPVLGRVSDFRHDLSAFFKKKRRKTRILCQYVNRSTIEDVRALSLSLAAPSAGERRRSLVVTSEHMDEGKSSLLTLLATELCNQGRRVLVIDMDTYAPSLGRLLCAHGDQDLLDHLGGYATLDQVIVPTPVGNLFLIDNLHTESITSRMVAAPAFLSFMKRVLKEFDYVLFDSPPMHLFADAAALGSVLDGTLLVVADGRTGPEALKETILKLQKANNRLLGLVFSCVPVRSAREYRDYEDQRKYAGA